MFLNLLILFYMCEYSIWVPVCSHVCAWCLSLGFLQGQQVLLTAESSDQLPIQVLESVRVPTENNTASESLYFHCKSKMSQIETAFRHFWRYMPACYHSIWEAEAGGLPWAQTSQPCYIMRVSTQTETQQKEIAVYPASLPNSLA